MADPKSDSSDPSQRFRAALEAARPPTGGVSLEDLEAELVPLLPLLTELPVEKRAGGDFESFGFRECFTVLALVGRRLALLDLTPTSAIQVMRLALHSLDQAGESQAEEFAERAVAAAMEGFVLGREERVAQVAEARAAAPIEPLRIDPSIFALIMSGVHDPTILSDRVDALGRAMLDSDVELAIVDLTQVGEPNRERAIALFAADEIARMLGGRCLFAGVDARWRAAAADARIPLEAMHVAPNLAGALAEARILDDRGSKTPNQRWRRLLGRLRR